MLISTFCETKTGSICVFKTCFTSPLLRANILLEQEGHR